MSQIAQDVLKPVLRFLHSLHSADELGSVDRGTDGGGGGEALRDREEEGKQGIRAEEGRGTSETYQTHTEVRRGGRRCRGGRRRGREQGERNGAETEGEEIDKAEMEF